MESNQVEREANKEKLSVAALRRLLEGDPQLKRLRCDDDYMLRFLYISRLNVESAFKMMKRFCELLYEFPDWFANDGPLAKKELIERNSSVMLSKTDRAGRIIYISKLATVDPGVTSFLDIAQIDDIMAEYISSDIRARRNGITVILDAKDCSWGLMNWISSENMEVATRKLESYPMKIGKIHIVNSSMIFTLMVNLAWSFLPAQTKRLITFHSNNWDELHEYIDPRILPPEYGGTGTIDMEEFYERLYSEDETIARSFHVNRVLH